MSNSYMITNRKDVNGTSSSDTQPLPDGQLWFYLSTTGPNDTNAADYSLTKDAGGEPSVSPPADFLADLQADLNATVTNNTAQLVIFIHGLADSFAQGVYDTGTIGAGLAQAGSGALVIGFSWPSYGLFDSVLDYKGVRRNINNSLESFSSLLAMVQTLSAGLASGVSLNVGLICHSEGNYMLMQGMSYLSSNPLSPWQNINNVLMLAADINDAALQVPSGQYVGTGAAISQLSAQVTIYYSNSDPELAFSAVTYKAYHNPDYPGRLGMEGPDSFDEGALETNAYGVDCSRVVSPAHILWLKVKKIIPWNVLEHSSYLYIPQILADLTQTMNGTAPGDVVNRKSLDAPDGQSYEMEVDDTSSVEFQAEVRARNASLMPGTVSPG
ncbi:MAG TPA: alpha/beta hydrolase [Pyrinomonadaceae bacterium]|nr:alpha/beta hydrolase [Pyrinomonadaceae bacterium]